MKKGLMAKKTERLTVSIIAVSIIALFLLAVLPWISVEENDYIKEDLHFNFQMMAESDNEQIVDLANNLDFINLCLWSLIILGLLTFLGSTIHAYGKITFVSHIMLFMGCATLIFSILIINMLVTILGKIEDINTVSASAIVPPLNYAYMFLIAILLLLIFSIAYVWTMSLHTIQKIKELIKDKQSGRDKDKKDKKRIKLAKKSKKPAKKEDHVVTKEIKKDDEDKKRANVEQWLAGEVQNIEKETPKEKTETEKAILEEPTLGEVHTKEDEPEKTIQDKEEIIEEPTETEKKQHVFPPEKAREKSEGAEEVPLAQSFEKALSSAINKKQTEIDDLEPLDSADEKEIEKSESVSENKENPKKKISVRCPQCKHIFTFQKQGKITRIKCPDCGKEGVVK